MAEDLAVFDVERGDDPHSFPEETRSMTTYVAITLLDTLLSQ